MPDTMTAEAVATYPAGTLLLVAAAAVAVLLFLIMKVKLHAFVALVLVSVVTAFAAGVPIAKIPDAMAEGFNSTLGSVALLVAFGVMLGRLLEVSGGAQILADTLVNRFGEQRAPLALGVAALLFGIPIFFDAGLVVFLPIILTVARRFGGSVLLYALPAAGAFAAMHAIIPPHPGPVSATEILGGSIGLNLLVGLPIAVITWYVGSYLVARVVGRRVLVEVPDLLFGEVNDGAGESNSSLRTPTFGAVLLLLLLPFILIAGNTVVTTLGTAGTLDADASWAQIIVLIGQTPVALLLTVLAAMGLLVRPGHFAAARDLMDGALEPICAIILITGAGGMFGGVLRASGIGNAMTASLGDLGLPLLLQAFVIATALRVAQGSATVAITTTSGLVASAAAEAGLSDLRLVLLVVAIAAGSTVLSHVNDSGFWLVSRFFQMDEKTTLKTWTVMETTIGVTAFLLAALLWPLG